MNELSGGGDKKSESLRKESFYPFLRPKPLPLILGHPGTSFVLEEGVSYGRSHSLSPSHIISDLRPLTASHKVRPDALSPSLQVPSSSFLTGVKQALSGLGATFLLPSLPLRLGKVKSSSLRITFQTQGVCVCVWGGGRSL